MKILRLYLLREQVSSFFLALVFFIFMFSLGNILKLAELFVKRIVGLPYLLRFCWYLSVGFLNFSIPLALFAATIIIFARLSADHEIPAISSSGINLYSFFFPLLIIALFLSLLTFYLNNITSPNLQFSSRKMVSELEIKVPPTNLIQEGTFIRDFKDTILFARRVKGKKVFDITIYKFNDQDLSTIKAERGTIFSPQKGRIALHLLDGFVQTYNSSHPQDYTNLRFKSYDFLLKKSSESGARRVLSKKVRECTLKELLREKRSWQKKGIKNLEISAEIQKRASFSFAPFIFVLLGIPLGIAIKHSGKFLDFTIVFFVILLYYLLSIIGEISSKKFLSPSLLWLPNIIFGGFGLFLLAKKVKR